MDKRVLEFSNPLRDTLLARTYTRGDINLKTVLSSTHSEKKKKRVTGELTGESTPTATVLEENQIITAEERQE